MNANSSKLKQLRKNIDALDKILLSNLKKRFRAVEKVALVKKKLNLPSHQKARWDSMLLERLQKAKKLKLDEHFITSLFKLIHKESKRIQNVKRKERKK